MIVQYIPHADVPAYEAQGWKKTEALTGTHHGHHAVLMTKEEGRPMDFETAREHAIMAKWRGGEDFAEICDYVGMEQRDVAAIIKKNIGKEPSLGWKYPQDIKRISTQLSRLELSVNKAEELLGSATTPAVKARLRAHMKAA